MLHTPTPTLTPTDACGRRPPAQVVFFDALQWGLQVLGTIVLVSVAVSAPGAPLLAVCTPAWRRGLHEVSGAVQSVP